MQASLSIRSYHECSSLLNIGVDDVFEAATRASMLVREDGGAPGAGAAHQRGSGDGAGGRSSRDRDREKTGGAGGGGKGCCIIL